MLNPKTIISNRGFRYRNVACNQLTDTEIGDCSRLFSENYGFWAESAGSCLGGKRIRLSPKRIKDMFVKLPGCHVSLMYDGSKLIGQVFYLKRRSPWHKAKNVTFVLQLVLDEHYRSHRIGLTMLQAVFGFSDDDAWGLFTSNPLTIRALEDATFRRISVDHIEWSIKNGMREVLKDVFDGTEWLDSFRNGCVNTNFHVGHGDNEKKKKKGYKDRPFPFNEDLKDGEEWLAIILNRQKVQVSEDVLNSLTTTSWIMLRDAYSRMPVKVQKWASFAVQEIDFLFDRGFVKAGDHVLDLGCGIGRHSIELARRGCVVHGVDFVNDFIDIAKNDGANVQNLTFEVGDALNYVSSKKFDVVLCAYDVIGSSIADEDVQAVVRTIGNNLKTGGLAIVSVMNLELTKSVCRRDVNKFKDLRTTEDFEKLFALPPSRTMQGSGDVFKGQLLLLNADIGVAYRKEKFLGENELPVEYVVPDRRFTKAQLCDLFRCYEEVYAAYVCAGHWDKTLRSDEQHAKEVLGVFRKLGPVDRIFASLRS